MQGLSKILQDLGTKEVASPIAVSEVYAVWEGSNLLSLFAKNEDALAEMNRLKETKGKKAKLGTSKIAVK